MKPFINNSVISIIITAFLCVVFQSQVSGTSAEKVEEAPRYVGMEKCKECHPEDVKTYSEWTANQAVL
jgi:hypothetical protein